MVGIERLLELSEDLKDFAKEIEKVPTASEMREKGPHDPNTYQRNFGSWNEALKVAGLKVNEIKRNVESKEKLIEDLQQFEKDLGRTPTVAEMNNRGPWSAETYYDRFGSWNGALEEAGLEINREQGIPKEQLIEDLKDFAEKIEKVPTYREMTDKGPWSGETYHNRFGTWNNALKKAGLEINRLDMKELAGTGEDAYGAGWVESRRETLERDNYTCQVCGFGDESNHVHHIKPRSEFDDVSDSNTDDNLITLCISCHGRCEGRWEDCDPDEFAERAADTFM
jgi:hypothetical protein